MSGVFTVFVKSKKPTKPTGDLSRSQLLSHYLSVFLAEMIVLDRSRCSAVAESPWSQKPGIVVFFREETAAHRFLSDRRKEAGEPTEHPEDKSQGSYLISRRLNAITVSACRIRAEEKTGYFFMDAGLIADRDSGAYKLSRGKK